MQYRKFGKLGIENSAFGLGCMRFPMIDDGNGKRVVDQELANQIVHTAIEGGVTYIDTAYVYSYGQAERVLGKALEGGWREKVNIATKLPSWMVKEYDDMEKLLDQELSSLQTDHIDFYLVHNLNHDQWNRVNGIGVTRFLDDMKAKGKITYAGFSFHDKYESFEEIITSYDWDFCQIQFNYMDINNQAGLKGLELAGSMNIPVVIMEGLLGGKLANVPTTVQKIFDEYPVKYTPAQWGFRWLCNFPQVATVLSGVTNVEMTLQNIETFSNTGIGILTQEELDIVARAREEYVRRTKVGCTGCRYCMPCPMDVDIPGIFATWNDRFKYSDDVSNCGHYIHRIKGSGHGADKCVECRQCMDHCPQGFDIPEMLRLADKEMS